MVLVTKIKEIDEQIESVKEKRPNVQIAPSKTDTGRKSSDEESLRCSTNEIQNEKDGIQEANNTKPKNQKKKGNEAPTTVEVEKNGKRMQTLDENAPTVNVEKGQGKQKGANQGSGNFGQWNRNVNHQWNAQYQGQGQRLPYSSLGQSSYWAQGHVNQFQFQMSYQHMNPFNMVHAAPAYSWPSTFNQGYGNVNCRYDVNY